VRRGRGSRVCVSGVSEAGATLLLREGRGGSRRGHAPVRGLVAALALLLGGCAFSVQVPATQPPAITQQLLARSLERALAQLDVKRFAGQQVTAEVFTQGGPQSGTQAFVKEFVVAWLGERGIRVEPQGAVVALKVFAPVFGTDQGQSLIGIPAFQAPVVNVLVPEIALFKWVRNRGQAEVQIYSFDAKTNTFLAKTPASIGRAKFDDFTVLLIINFTVTDVDKPARE
jgi:hypothetical protein